MLWNARHTYDGESCFRTQGRLLVQGGLTDSRGRADIQQAYLESVQENSWPYGASLTTQTLILDISQIARRAKSGQLHGVGPREQPRL